MLKATKGVSLLKSLCKYVDRNVLDLSYRMYIIPHLDYGDVIFHNQRTLLNAFNIKQLLLFLVAGRELAG